MGFDLRRPPPPPPIVRVFRCHWCGRVLGRVVDGILHEASGGKSGLPCVRRCPGCGRRNVKLA